MEEMRLRALQPEDEAAMVAMLRSEEVARTFMLPDFETDEEAAKLFRRLMALSQGTESYVRGACVGETLVGFVNQVACEEETIEVGYVIAPEHWNRGFGTAMLRKAMEDLRERGFRRICAGFFVGNEASRRVMEKCGMVPMPRVERIEYRGRIRQCLYMEKCI